MQRVVDLVPTLKEVTVSELVSVKYSPGKLHSVLRLDMYWAAQGVAEGGFIGTTCDNSRLSKVSLVTQIHDQ